MNGRPRARAGLHLDQRFFGIAPFTDTAGEWTPIEETGATVAELLAGAA